jgi:hypothetical protein
MTRHIPARLTAAALLLLPLACLASDWGPWEVMSGSGRLSMRSVQTNLAGCAFAFRNDSTTLTLEGAKIHYIHSGRVDDDILPALRPQQSLGGWTAFSVDDKCENVRVQIYDETWK